MFIKAMNGEIFAANKVDKIWKEKGPNDTIDGFADIDGVGRVRLYYGEYERLFAGKVSFVPANPGWKTLERFEDGDGYDLLENDVLSWAIYDDGGVLPVTLEGVHCGESRWEAFVRPDGKIVDKTGMNELDRKDFYKDKK